MLTRTLVFALCCTALGYRVGSRAGSIRMGLAVGEKFPAPALKSWGVSGKKACVFFYGADDAPSCSKELLAFNAALDDFKSSGVTVVGVRNAAGVKAADDDFPSLKIVVDDGDSVRNEVGIAKDIFGLLGGRETYVLDSSGTVVAVHNNQFDPESHVKVALSAAETMPKGGFELPDLSKIFA